MRITLMALAGLATLLAVPVMTPSTSNAEVIYPWCAHYGRDSGTNCGFVTFQQCLATVSGIGGFCAENPFYQGAVAGERARRRDRRGQQPRY
jgi:hypothetical protein